MRPWLVHLFCGSALMLAAVPAAHAQVSERMRTLIRAGLPKYTPEMAENKLAGSSVGMPAPLSDDPIVLLPDFKVQDRRPLESQSDSWLDKEGRQEKALKEYKASMNDLEWALNRWYVPLPFGFSLTPPAQNRADAAYADRKIATEVQQLSSVIEAVNQVDPVEARKLARDLDLSRHPDN